MTNKRLDGSLENSADVETTANETPARIAEINCDINRRIALYELNSRKERNQYGFITIKGDKK